MGNLAIHGGSPVRSETFPRHPVIGAKEKQAVAEVMDSGELSSFVAISGENFLGGKRVLDFEQRFADYHGTKFAISFNSATSALHAAVVAVGVDPGEEVIVTPYSFSASAACALMHGAIPVFGDVQEDIYCLDPQSVESLVSPLTKVVIPVHLFGHPADMDELMKVARKHDLKVIEDCAQSPGAFYKGQRTGTIGDCGVFSFTENKNITTGEGGMLITNDPRIAEVAQLVRNHGEVIDPGDQLQRLGSIYLGWNYRLTEFQAALGIVQFDKLDALNVIRTELAGHLNEKLRGARGLTISTVYPDCTHVYYIYALKYDADEIGVSRDLFIKALAAEGIPFGGGYVPPLYESPYYQKKLAAPFRYYKGNAQYSKGTCPTCEQLYERDLIITQIARSPATKKDMDDVVLAFEKIFDNISDLQ